MSEIPIIPRTLLLGNPSALDPKLSPDGRFLAWLAPVGAVMNVWVAPTDAIGEARPLTEMDGRPPVWSSWSWDGRFVMFLKDENGDENYNLYVVERETRDLRNLTPIPKASVVIYLRSPDLPNRVLIGLNDRDPRWHDVWSVDLASGERTLVYENTAGFGWLLFDWSGQIRFAGRNEAAKGGQRVYRMETAQPEPWRLIPFDDTFSTDLIFFDRTGERLFVRSSLNRDRSALVRIDMATDAETVLAEHPRADIGEAIWDARTFEILAVSAEHLRQEWIALDERAGRTIDMIRICARLRIHSPQQQRGQHALDDRRLRPAPSLAFLPRRPRSRRAARIVQRSTGAEALSPRRRTASGGQVARWARSRLLRGLAGRRAHRPAARAFAHGFIGSWRSLVARLLRL